MDAPTTITRPGSILTDADDAHEGHLHFDRVARAWRGHAEIADERPAAAQVIDLADRECA